MRRFDQKKRMKMMKITEEMKVCEVLDLDDRLETIFENHGLLCSGCPGAIQETLREAAEGHEIDVNELLKDLNEEA